VRRSMMLSRCNLLAKFALATEAARLKRDQGNSYVLRQCSIHEWCCAAGAKELGS